VNIAGLTPHPRNYNAHDDAQIGDLRASLRKFGQVRSIVVQATPSPRKGEGRGEGRYLIVAGHGLVAAARLEGYTTLRADVIPAKWNATRVLAYLAADNELAKHGTPDQAQLAAIVAELAAANETELARLAAGNAARLKELLAANALATTPQGDAEPQIDRAAELNEKWKVKPGDLWRIGDHRLLCGDSTRREDVERVMQGEKAQMIFTDPPYGVDYDGGAKKRKSLEGDHVGTEIYAQAIPLIAEYVDDNAALYLWYADGHAAAAAAAAAGYIITAQIIWAKNNAQFVTSAHYKGKHEPCYYAHKKGKSARWHGPNNEVTLWEYDRANANDFHSTQKPIELSRRAISNSTQSGDIVLDAFLGSGATMVSCQNLQRKCRAIEIAPAYCAVTLERMATAFPGIEIERMASTNGIESANGKRMGAARKQGATRKKK
jgi:DNA modification methylase